jgi:hypothetical protein
MTEHSHSGPNSQLVTHNHNHGGISHDHDSLKPFHVWTWQLRSAASDVNESSLAGQVRAASHPDDIMCALHAARPEDRAGLLSLRGVGMLRRVARLCDVDAGTMTKKDLVKAISENF